ncbi:hypothetical protein [Lysobacter capsici]|uniref:hypothetical protein n=1 Tax=Lysobacter capsici TaxID=435897 RepID=UPI001C003FA5|nr:hypothetical protein [Lysobacter capsici]QWF19292.1 hypothetical protein KME82_11400 [Lysobacter capsici]
MAIIGSTVQTTVDGVAFDPDWSLVLGDGSVDYSVRITPLPYTSIGQGFGEGPSSFRFTRADSSTADVVNGDAGETADEFIPNPVTGTGRKIDYFPGTGSETSRNESWQMLVEIEDVAPPAETCQELGRVTRAYASAYDRTRIHRSRLAPNEKRCLIAAFNGAIPLGRTITRAEWRLDRTYSVTMSAGSIEGRDVRVMIQARNRGISPIRCEATLDNGEIYVQLFEIEVVDGPYFGDAQLAAGPAVIVVDA